jgi:hypothetical protein
MKLDQEHRFFEIAGLGAIGPKISQKQSAIPEYCLGRFLATKNIGFSVLPHVVPVFMRFCKEV